MSQLFGFIYGLLILGTIFGIIPGLVADMATKYFYYIIAVIFIIMFALAKIHGYKGRQSVWALDLFSRLIGRQLSGVFFICL